MYIFLILWFHFAACFRFCHGHDLFELALCRSLEKTQLPRLAEIAQKFPRFQAQNPARASASASASARVLRSRRVPSPSSRLRPLPAWKEEVGSGPARPVFGAAFVAPTEVPAGPSEAGLKAAEMQRATRKQSGGPGTWGRWTPRCGSFRQTIAQAHRTLRWLLQHCLPCELLSSNSDFCSSSARVRRRAQSGQADVQQAQQAQQQAQTQESFFPAVSFSSSSRFFEAVLDFIEEVGAGNYQVQQEPARGGRYLSSNSLPSNDARRCFSHASFSETRQRIAEAAHHLGLLEKLR